MKKIFLILFFLFASIGQTKPSPSYFPFNVNSWWQYKTNFGTTKIFIQPTQNKNIIKRQLKGLMKYTEFYKWDKHGIYCFKKVAKKDIYIYTPKTLSYKLPLVQGQSWEWTGTETKGKKIVHSMLKAHVVGDETITVPAGTFLCRKIWFQYSDDNGTKFTYYQWLDKNVGMVQTIGRIKGKGLFGLIAKIGGGKFVYKLKKYHIE